MTCKDFSPNLLRDLYAKMLLTRIVDCHIQNLQTQGQIDFATSCQGHEAVQVGSAWCIEVGQDFTLPYSRDLGVVLTIGMTPYEIFRTHLQTGRHDPSTQSASHVNAGMVQTAVSWSYHKHNTITSPAPVATQLLHAAGIAFASKLRKAPVVTVAYCDAEAVHEPDFTEAMHFAAQHQLPVIFICENRSSSDVSTDTSTFAKAEIQARPLPSCLQDMTLPGELAYQRIDGTDIVAVYSAMRQVMDHARSGAGPTLLEMIIPEKGSFSESTENNDPLVRCQHYLQSSGNWDEQWAARLRTRLTSEVEHVLQDALRDTPQIREESRAEQ